MALTKIFPAHIKPVRVGVYKTKIFEWRYSYWDGKFWSFSKDSVCDAYAVKWNTSNFQNKQWRGLTTEQKA